MEELAPLVKKFISGIDMPDLISKVEDLLEKLKLIVHSDLTKVKRIVAKYSLLEAIVALKLGRKADAIERFRMAIMALLTDEIKCDDLTHRLKFDNDKELTMRETNLVKFLLNLLKHYKQLKSEDKVVPLIEEIDKLIDVELEKVEKGSDKEIRLLLLKIHMDRLKVLYYLDCKRHDNLL